MTAEAISWKMKIQSQFQILVRSSIDLAILMKIANDDINKILSHYKHKLTLDIKNIDLNINELEKLPKSELFKIAKILDSYSVKLKELHHINKNKMLEKNKRKVANISVELEELYNSLSDHVHHGYDALVQRHSIIKNKKYRASLSKIMPNPLIYMWLHCLLLCIEISTAELIKSIGLPKNHNLKFVYEEIYKLDVILKKFYC